VVLPGERTKTPGGNGSGNETPETPRYQLDIPVGCGSNGGPIASPGTAGPATTPTRSSPLVGEWQRVNRCEEMVQALKQAGLEKAIPEMVARSELVPGVVNDPNLLADTSQPCNGALSRIHSHCFSESG
jgi:hypothetical protein